METVKNSKPKEPQMKKRTNRINVDATTNAEVLRFLKDLSDPDWKVLGGPGNVIEKATELLAKMSR
jgi:hypothetical protein